ncbi:MAG: shikimate kinase [Pseudomonadales bacterium]|nr:shikimate kinase [Pseudomonadales bacterium]
MNNQAKSISLIGMPGVGKSTIGVVLAKLCGLRFVDTDLDIQVHAGATLQEILERDGYRQLRALEQEVLLGIDLDRAIIATGGSVVYSAAAMRRLKTAGAVVYLEADLDTLQRRVAAAPPRGIACDGNQGFADICAERTPLYRQYADFTVDATAGSPEAVAQTILLKLAAPG